MKGQEKAKRIQQILDRLYPLPAIPLSHRDPYTLLVATVLSAQCTDARVNQVAPKLFARAASPGKMVGLRPQEIEEIVRPCGLAPSKSRAIAALSQILESEHGGVVPQTFAELERLPGVGHKTASVIVSQAFGRPAFPVDTHIHRLAARWGLSSGKSVGQTERDLKKLYPAKSWGRLHLQLIYFGREHCPARGHDFLTCAICSWAASKRRIAAETSRLKKGQ